MLQTLASIGIFVYEMNGITVDPTITSTCKKRERENTIIILTINGTTRYGLSYVTHFNFIITIRGYAFKLV